MVHGHQWYRGHKHPQCRQLGCVCTLQVLMPGYCCQNFVAVLEQKQLLEQKLVERELVEQALLEQELVEQELVENQ